MNEVNQNVFKSEQLGELFFHEHVAGTNDCLRCVLCWKRGSTFRIAAALQEECIVAPCCSGDREDGRSGYFCEVKEEKEEA